MGCVVSSRWNRAPVLVSANAEAITKPTKDDVKLEENCAQAITKPTAINQPTKDDVEFEENCAYWRLCRKLNSPTTHLFQAFVANDDARRLQEYFEAGCCTDDILIAIPKKYKIVSHAKRVSWFAYALSFGCTNVINLMFWYSDRLVFARDFCDWKACIFDRDEASISMKSVYYSYQKIVATIQSCLPIIPGDVFHLVIEYCTSAVTPPSNAGFLFFSFSFFPSSEHRFFMC